MATQTINTRIKNKVDSITNWQESTSPLLDGEIAIVRVETGSTYTNPITGKAEPVVELLMKVGNGTASFADLPWLSAKASDVYDWAKKGTANEIPISIIEGNNESATTGTLGSWLKTAYDKGVKNASEISSIKSAIAGGTHFVGTTTTVLSDGATTNPVTVNSKSHTPVAGDIVLYDNKEFIWTGSAWEELGDLTRVGALETWRGKLVKADAAIANQFVTEVDIAADGTVSIGRAQPTSANIKHGDSGTVSSVLADHEDKFTGLTHSTVQESINEKIKALDLTTDPDSGGEAESTENFVTQVRQTDGKVSYSRKSLPKASSSKVGIVQLADGTSSSDATKAATAASTKSAYDKAVNAQGRISTVEGNYVRFANDKLYIGLTGTDEIIFDCGTSTNL